MEKEYRELLSNDARLGMTVRPYASYGKSCGSGHNLVGLLRGLEIYGNVSSVHHVTRMGDAAA